MRFFREPVVFFLVTVQLAWSLGLFLNAIKRYGVFSLSFIERILSFVISFGLYSWLDWPVFELYLTLYLGQGFGSMLFHLQHSVNLPYRERKHKWEFSRAALEGSTFMHIPEIFKPFSNGIEYHHIHHLNTNVASYVIRDCHESLEKDSKSGHDWNFYNIREVGM